MPKSKTRRKPTRRPPHRSSPACPSHTFVYLGQIWDFITTGTRYIYFHCTRCKRITRREDGNLGIITTPGYIPGETRTTAGYIVGGNPDPRGSFIWR